MSRYLAASELRSQQAGREGSLVGGRLCEASSVWSGHDARARFRHLQTSRSSPSTHSCQRALIEGYSSLMLRGLIVHFGKCSGAHRQLVWVSEDMIAERQSTAQHLCHDRVSAPCFELMHSRAQINHHLHLHGVHHHGAPRACLGCHRLR